jgi:4-amino-4-deoxy-L-arabinose transferase-like glycosyltransferase
MSRGGPTEGNLDESATATRGDWIAPTALVLFAWIVRELRWLQATVMMNDGPEFIRIAQRFAAGDWRTALGHDYHPLYPLAVAAAHPIFGDWERAAVAVSVAAGALAVAALFALLRAAFDRRTACVGAFLLAVHPIAIEFSDVQSDAFYLCLFVASAWLLFGAVQGASARAAFVAGAASGLAYLARPEGLGTVVVGVGLAAYELARRHWKVSVGARFVAALVLGAVLVMSPYVALLSARSGTLMLTGKKSVAGVLGVSAARAWLTTGSVEYRPPKALDPLLAERPDLTPPPPGVTPFRDAPVAKGAARYPRAAALIAGVIPKALRPELLVLLAFGLWAARGRGPRRAHFFAAYTALYLFVLFGLAASSGYVSRRHVLPPGTLLFGYAALGAGVLASSLERIPAVAKRLTPAVSLGVVLALIGAAGLGKALSPKRGNSLPERLAAEWVRESGGLAPEEAVGAVKQRVGYYAGARFVDLRHAPHDALLIPFLKRERARYVVVDDSERTELERMLAGAPGAVRLVHEERVGRDAAFVYEVQ